MKNYRVLLNLKLSCSVGILTVWDEEVIGCVLLTLNVNMATGCLGRNNRKCLDPLLNTSTDISTLTRFAMKGFYIPKDIQGLGSLYKPSRDPLFQCFEDKLTWA